jgi:hypothetical protein
MVLCAILFMFLGPLHSAAHTDGSYEKLPIYTISARKIRHFMLQATTIVRLKSAMASLDTGVSHHQGIRSRYSCACLDHKSALGTRTPLPHIRWTLCRTQLGRYVIQLLVPAKLAA